jgi:CBS domain-containing protein
MKMKIVPDVIGRQTLAVLSPDATVLEASKLMAARKIGAVLIGQGQNLAGIFTERDIAFKIVAGGRDPAQTRLSEVMTARPTTISPDQTAFDALQMMSKGGYRHLPVLEDGKLIGMVSIRDIYAAMLHELEEELHDREAFIQGSAGYGLT